MTLPVASQVLQEEIHPAVSLLGELQVSVGGIATPSLHRALCTSKDVLAIAGREQDKVAGIAVIQLSRRWLYFHPFLAVRMLLSRFKRQRAEVTEASVPAETAQQASQILARERCPVSWDAPVPRTIFIGVHPHFRGHGLASAMYREVFTELRRRGYRLLLARIAKSNEASLILHSQTKWTLFEDSGVITAVKDLSEPEFA